MIVREDPQKMSGYKLPKWQDFFSKVVGMTAVLTLSLWKNKGSKNVISLTFLHPDVSQTTAYKRPKRQDYSPTNVSIVVGIELVPILKQ